MLQEKSIPNLKKLLFLASFCVALQVGAQDRPGFVSIGYQYAYFGNSLASNQVRMAGENKSVAPGGNKATNYQHGYGLVLRGTFPSENNFQVELTASNKKVMADRSYQMANADSSAFTPIDVKLRTRIRSFSVGGSYFIKNFSIGGSVDLGIFASYQKYSGIEGESNKKWIPWFMTPKVIGGGYTGKTPVLGFSLFASYRIAQTIQLRVYKQFTGFGLGAELSDNFFSISNIGAELAFTFPKKRS